MLNVSPQTTLLPSQYGLQEPEIASSGTQTRHLNTTNDVQLVSHPSHQIKAYAMLLLLIGNEKAELGDGLGDGLQWHKVQVSLNWGNVSKAATQHTRADSMVGHTNAFSVINKCN